MRKESFYFPHDTSAHSDPKIMELLSSCGLSGVGIYWILIEILHQEPDSSLTTSSFRRFIQFYSQFESRGTEFVERLERALIDSELMFVQNEHVFSNRVLRNKEDRKSLSEIRAEAGRKSGVVRAKLSEEGTNAQQKGTKAQLGKERKGKEIVTVVQSTTPPRISIKDESYSTDEL